MARFEDRLKAFELRRKGWSIKSIAKELKTAKSTASIWCRNIKLTPIQERTLTEKAIASGHAGRIKGAEMNRRKKQLAIEYYLDQGKKEITNLTRQELLTAGLGIYWAEGSKTGSKFGISNSDPKMIIFMVKWFREILGVHKEDLMPRIFINAIHEERIDQVLDFWAKLLDLPKTQFAKPVLLRQRPKKVYENHETYYGVLALGVRRGTILKYRVLGLISSLQQAGVA